MSYNQILLIAYLAAVVIMSLVAIAAYFKDKKVAMQSNDGKDRTKEKTLLFYAVFFGAPGAFLGRILARHKTNKIYFSIVIYFALICQVGLAVLLSSLAIIA